MKTIHPKTKKCNFLCATCGANFEIDVIINSDNYGIDICSKCHPFYIGKTSKTQLRGRSEKLSSKFETGKSTIAAKPAKSTEKVRKQKENKGFDVL